jgi:hypothetical protein
VYHGVLRGLQSLGLPTTYLNAGKQRRTVKKPEIITTTTLEVGASDVGTSEVGTMEDPRVVLQELQRVIISCT